MTAEHTLSRRKRPTIRRCVAGCVLALANWAIAAPAPNLPVVVSADAWEPLYDRVDSALQAALETRLAAEPAWAALIKKKKMAVGLVDMTEPEQARFARVNGRTMMYAASLPKIAIMLAAVQALEDGVIEETPENVEDLNRMIRFSSNRAAARMYNLVGFERIRALLQDPRYGLFDETRGGGLWVGKPYSKVGKRHGDPLKGLSHGATATQVCRFYYLLATGRLINPERSHQMLQYLHAPGVHHKFVHSLEALAPRADLYRKSGTWRQWHSDSVLVWGPDWRRYILVALVEDAQGSRIMQRLVPAVEDVLGH